MPTDDFRPLVDLFKALAHPVRLRILVLLHGSEMCVCEVAGVLGLAPSTVSEHLTALRRTGLVREWKVGRWVHVSLSEEVAARSVLESLWPLMVDLAPNLPPNRPKRPATAVLCETCPPAECPQLASDSH